MRRDKPRALPAGLIVGLSLALLLLFLDSCGPKPNDGAADLPGFVVDLEEAGIEFVHNQPEVEGPHDFGVFDGHAYVLDAASHRVLFFDLKDGSLRKTIDYPDEYYPRSVAYDGQRLHLLDLSRCLYVRLGRSEVDEEVVCEPATLKRDAVGVYVEPSEMLSRPTFHIDPGHKVTLSISQERRWGPVHIEAGSGAAFSIESPYLLAGVELLGIDRDGNYYFVMEELLDSHMIQADRTVWRYTSDGTPTGVYQVPFPEYYVFPTRDLFFDTETGLVFNLIVTEDTLEVRAVTWQDPDEYQRPVAQAYPGTGRQFVTLHRVRECFRRCRSGVQKAVAGSASAAVPPGTPRSGCGTAAPHIRVVRGRTRTREPEAERARRS